MKVWIAHVTTESSDHYYYAFKKEPKRDDVVEKVWKSEGMIEDLNWYKDTTSVEIVGCTVL